MVMPLNLALLITQRKQFNWSIMKQQPAESLHQAVQTSCPI
jgi:hypothetical protein